MNDYKRNPQGVISFVDVEHLQQIRENVREFMIYAGREYGQKPAKLLDIAPQDHAGARPHFPQHVLVETFDIDPAAGATHTGDLCKHNSFLTDNTFDLVVCTEVLEHTLQPFAAAAELRRLIRPGGYLFLSVPFNFRIHGPLPDCWRFTEHGLRALFSDWEIVRLTPLECPDRFLMPIHYTLIAQKPTS